jgi:hypothetical protein
LAAAPPRPRKPATLVRRFLAAACIAVLAAGSVAAQPPADKPSSYSDPKYLFRISYPSGWRQVQSELPYTVFAVDNAKPGAARQAVSVRVYALAESNYADPAEFVFQFLSGVEEGGGLDGLTENHPLKAFYPDIKAVEYGETTIGAASAFYVLSRFTGRQEEGLAPFNVMQILTMRDDNVFELTYSARLSDFQEQRKSLAAIAETFAFD